MSLISLKTEQNRAASGHCEVGRMLLNGELEPRVFVRLSFFCLVVSGGSIFAFGAVPDLVPVGLLASVLRDVTLFLFLSLHPKNPRGISEVGMGCVG